MKMLARVVILFFIMLVVGACSSSETSNDSEEESKAENESEASEEETSENNQTHENKYEGELGDYEVYITGEMREEDDKIIIEGESNLLRSEERRVGKECSAQWTGERRTKRA